MSKERCTALLFPGQGAYQPGSLLELHHADHDAAAAIRAIDEAIVDAGGGPGDRPVVESGRSIDELLATSPQSLQVSIFALSVAVFAGLRSSLSPGDVLVGHSLGEVAALTCAGAFSAADGARIVRARTAAAQAVAGGGMTAAARDTTATGGTTAAAGGGMMAVAANAEIAEALVRAAADHRVAVAAHNAPQQAVLSGPLPALNRVRAAAGALGISCVILQSPFAFHNPLLAPAIEPFRAQILAVRQRPLLRRVYSPILGRFYSDDDDLRELLVSHLVRPVRFVDAIRLLHSRSFSVFVECGAREVLSTLVQRTVPGVVTIATLEPGRPARETLDAAIDRLAAVRGGDDAVAALVVRDTPAPPAAAPSADQPHVTEPPAIEAPAGEPSAVGLERATILAELRASYAAALDYPESLFTEDADLEADLGVDSVKQTELLSRVTDRYALSFSAADIRMSELGTMSRLADFVLGTTISPATVPMPVPKPASVPAPPPDPGPVLTPTFPEPRLPAEPTEPTGRDRARVLAELRTVYALALDYPESLLAEDADLEADLGVDSVKQTELLARITEQYALSTLPANFRLAELTNLGAIADLVMDSSATAA